jgi:hypothetical protein
MIFEPHATMDGRDVDDVAIMIEVETFTPNPLEVPMPQPADSSHHARRERHL